MRGHLEAKWNREARIAERKGHKPPSAERLEEIIAGHLERMFGPELEEVMAEQEEKAWTGFFSDEISPYIGTYQLKACFRDVFTSLGYSIKRKGSKQTYQHLMNLTALGDLKLAKGSKQKLQVLTEVVAFEADPVQKHRIRFYRDDDMTELIEEPDGYIEKTANVSTAQGPRSILKRHDKIERPYFQFGIWIPQLQTSNKTRCLSDKEYYDIIMSMRNNGLGACRSVGHGTFEILGFDKFIDNPPAK
jgi:hypothetical protein